PGILDAGTIPLCRKWSGKITFPETYYCTFRRYRHNFKPINLWFFMPTKIAVNVAGALQNIKRSPIIQCCCEYGFCIGVAILLLQYSSRYIPVGVHRDWIYYYSI